MININTLSLATTSIATQDEEYPGVAYPLEHALVYYLKHQHVNFDFIFTWPYLYPKKEIGEAQWLTQIATDVIEYPHSFDLAERLEYLCARGILAKLSSSIEVFTAGPIALKREKDFIERFNKVGGVKYSRLRSLVREALENPKNLLDQCYKLYINEMY